jgi:hypothetical protein
MIHAAPARQQGDGVVYCAWISALVLLESRIGAPRGRKALIWHKKPQKKIVLGRILFIFILK